jgi:hypothetical protein
MIYSIKGTFIVPKWIYQSHLQNQSASFLCYSLAGLMLLKKDNQKATINLSSTECEEND